MATRDVLAWLPSKCSGEWSAENLAPFLSSEILGEICTSFDALDAPVQVHTLLAILALRRSQFSELRGRLEKLVQLGRQSEDEWVRVVAGLLLDVPHATTSTPLLSLETVDNKSFQETFDILRQRVEERRAPGALVPLDYPYLAPSLTAATGEEEAPGTDAEAHFQLKERADEPRLATGRVASDARAGQKDSRPAGPLAAKPAAKPAPTLTSAERAPPQRPQSASPPPSGPEAASSPAGPRASDPSSPSTVTSKAPQSRPSFLQRPSHRPQGAPTSGGVERKGLQKTSRLKMIDVADAASIMQQQNAKKAAPRRPTAAGSSIGEGGGGVAATASVPTFLPVAPPAGPPKEEAAAAKERKKREREGEREKKRAEKKAAREAARAERKAAKAAERAAAKEAKAAARAAKRARKGPEGEDVKPSGPPPGAVPVKPGELGTAAASEGEDEEDEPEEDEEDEEDDEEEEDEEEDGLSQAGPPSVVAAMAAASPAARPPAPPMPGPVPMPGLVRAPGPLNLPPGVSVGFRTAAPPFAPPGLPFSAPAPGSLPGQPRPLFPSPGLFAPAPHFASLPPGPPPPPAAPPPMAPSVAAILPESNCLGAGDRAAIAAFLSGDVRRPPDSGPVRQVLAHQVELPLAPGSPARILEQIVFEMNYEAGTWRKIKRRVPILTPGPAVPPPARSL